MYIKEEDHLSTLISLRLPEAILKPLDELSSDSERPRTYLIVKAIQNYLEECNDYKTAMERLHDESDKIISPAQLRKKLGV